MPTPTYTPLANITLGSAAASVTFSSISQAYRDLILVIQGTSVARGNLYVRLNGDTGSNYSYVYAGGNGSSTESGSSGSSTGMVAGAIETTGISQSTYQFMDYSATDKHTTGLNRTGEAGTFVSMWANRWANTAAVTSLTVTLNGNSFAAGSTFALYGVAA